jgi:hypothetical protein
VIVLSRLTVQDVVDDINQLLTILKVQDQHTKDRGEKTIVGLWMQLEMCPMHLGEVEGAESCMLIRNGDLRCTWTPVRVDRKGACEIRTAWVQNIPMGQTTRHVANRAIAQGRHEVPFELNVQLAVRSCSLDTKSIRVLDKACPMLAIHGIQFDTKIPSVTATNNSCGSTRGPTDQNLR